MKKWSVRSIALVTVMAALVCTLTLIRPIPSPVGGYIHLGDIGANFAALAFGPWLGFLIVGGGMMIADLIGFPIFAPGTLIVHGLQAVLVAYLGRNRKWWVMILAALAGGVVVVVGYFAYEWLLLRIGGLGQIEQVLGEVPANVPAMAPAERSRWAASVAAAEVPFNILQVLTGLVGVLVYTQVARAYPPLTRWLDRDKQ
jgi:energy-coupling factor transport system substrate-specific component